MMLLLLWLIFLFWLPKLSDYTSVFVLDSLFVADYADDDAIAAVICHCCS